VNAATSERTRALRNSVGDVMTSRHLMQHMHVLCDVIGKRPAGSEAEARARDYITQCFTDYGLAHVVPEPFVAPHWHRGVTTARIIVPTERSIELLALPLNRSHRVRAEVVAASFRTREEFERVAPRLQSKIVLVHGEAVTGVGPGVLHRSERVRLAHRAGAAAFLWVSNWPGHVLPTGSMDPGIAETMPAFGISQEDAALIERLVARHDPVELDIVTENSLTMGTSWNVSAELPGRHDAPIVLITAHYDSHDITDGAFDNAAGCAIVLECARVLAAHDGSAACTYRFVLFSAEEVGLRGSKHYAVEHADEIDRIRFMLNMDGLGVAPTTKYVHVPFHGRVAQYVRDTFVRYGIDATVDNALHLNWDHAPFAVRGVPVGSMTAKWRAGTQVHYGHTRSDTLDKIDSTTMRDITSSCVVLAHEVANDRTWPIEHLTQSDVRAELEARDMVDKLAEFSV
jgi:hypothetical protein